MTTAIKRDAEFWNATTLEQLTREEWEDLCDGCAKCCLHKLEDDGEIYCTDFACELLNLDACTCSDYPNRHINVPNCISFNAEDVVKMHWLPDICAYRLRSRGEPLYEWHYLISGHRKNIHVAGESVRDFAVIYCGQDFEEHVVYFKP